jgi:uroporphyrinogen-III synthase
VTRPRARAEALCFLLEDEGAEVIALPLLEFLPPDDPRPLAAAAEQIHRYRWIMFASPSAVHGLLEAVREAGTRARLGLVKLACVGPATAAAVRAAGLEVTLEAERSTGLGLFDRAKDDLQPGDEVLLPAAQEGRPELEEALREFGAHVSRVAAYKSVASSLPPQVLEALRQHPPAVALFGSPRTVDAFLASSPEIALEVLRTSRVVAMGPTTAAALESRAVPVAAIAGDPSAEGLVDAAVRALRGPVS